MSILTLGLGLGLGLLTGCDRNKNVAARVNDEPITKAAFEQQAEANLARFRGQARALPPGAEARIKQSVLRRMMEDEIVAQKAKELHLEVAPKDVEARLTQHKERFPSPTAFADHLQRAGISADVLRDDIRHGLLREAVIDKLTGTLEVSDEDVQKFYDAHLDNYREAHKVRARRIVVRLPAGSDIKTKKAKQKEAAKLLGLAKKPGADFAKLAHDKSEAPEAAHDGDIEWVEGRSLPPELQGVASLEAGKLSEVIETKLGFEIVQVVEQVPAQQKSLDQVKDFIRSSLLARARNDKRRDIMADLISGAKQEVLMTFEPSPSPVGGTPPPTPHKAASPPPPPPAEAPPPLTRVPGHEGGAPPPPGPPPGVPPPSGASPSTGGGMAPPVPPDGSIAPPAPNPPPPAP